VETPREHVESITWLPARAIFALRADANREILASRLN
jgi:hypothetical protein